MDEYGMCRLDDAPMLAEKLKNGESIMFGFGIDTVNAYVMFIAPKFTKIGTLPFGGNPFGAFAVGVLYKGFFYFDLKGSELFPRYVEEKLGLALPDAEAVTKMLNAIRGELVRV